MMLAIRYSSALDAWCCQVLRAFQSSSFAVSSAHAALAEAIAVFRREKRYPDCFAMHIFATNALVRSLIQVNHQTYEQLSTLKIPAAVSRLTRGALFTACFCSQTANVIV